MRFLFRSLIASPAYTLTCLTVLALGLGANTAIFSAVYSVVLKPLPYPNVERLVFVWERFPGMPDPPGGRIQTSRGSFLEWKRQNTVFEDMAVLCEAKLSEGGVDRPRHVSVEFVSANLLTMLGARPRAGRVFRAEEEVKDSDHVAVLSDSYFESRFQRNPNAVGKSVILGGVSYTVIGVLPPKFRLPATWQGFDQENPEVWVPATRRFSKPEDQWARQFKVVARLKPGATLAMARTEMDQIAARLEIAYPQLNSGWRTNVFPLTVENDSPELNRALWILLGAAGFLLLIACANLANLTLARATLRAREVAVRLALGATRGRILADLLAESLVVALLGAAAGLLVATGLIQAMAKLRPPDFEQLGRIELDLPVFFFAAAIAVVTAMLFGLAPAWMSSRISLNSALKSGGAHGASAARVRSRQFLIAVEVALALILVSGAGLMMRSFREVLATGIGFDTSRLTSVDIDLPERYDSAAQSRFFHALIEKARETPGVVSAGVVSNLPLHSIAVNFFLIAGKPEPPKDAVPTADFAYVSPEYFSVLGLPLRAGRFFTEGDVALNEKDNGGVVMVSQSFADKYLNGENPLTERILSQDKKNAYQIVGVVADYRALGAEGGARPEMFFPFMKLRGGSLVVRTKEPPAKLSNALRQAIASLDKDVSGGELKTMDERLDYWLTQRKFNTLLLAGFAGLALVLAMIGVYGVLANLVSSRTREIGIRMAIGAAPAQIGRLVLVQSMTPVAIGIAVGIAGSIALAKSIEALLFQVKARDPLTLSAAVLVILLVAPLAVAVPLWRATRVECTIALRDE